MSATWDVPDPVSGLSESGILVMGPGAKRADSGFVGPTSKLNQDENMAVQLAKKYAMEQSIKMVSGIEYIDHLVNLNRAVSALEQDWSRIIAC